MKRYSKNFTLSFFLVVVFSAQSFSLNSGHMLGKFELIEDKEKPLLSFNGFFEPSQFLNIQINPGNNKTETRIIIPNTFINNLLLKEGEFSSFSSDSILRKVTLNENVKRKANGEIQSSVKIIVSTKGKYMIEFDTENSDSRKLTFSLQKLKKNLNTASEGIGILIPQSDENNLENLNNNPRKTILLHPITALMSYRKFDQLKVSVLNASPNYDAAQKLSAMLVRQQKKNIEKRMGMNLKIINISSVNQRTILKRTKIYFHQNFLRAALILAEVLPGEQVLEPFPESRKSKISNDVQIFVGENFE